VAIEHQAQYKGTCRVNKQRLDWNKRAMQLLYFVINDVTKWCADSSTKCNPECAQYTYIGRAYLYGLMAGGQDGVERALQILQNQMIRSMKLLGVSSLEELQPKHAEFLATHQGLGKLPN